MQGTNGCLWLAQVECTYSTCNHTSSSWYERELDPVSWIEDKFNDHADFGSFPEVTRGSFFKQTQCYVHDGYCVPQAAYPFLGKFTETYFNPRYHMALSSIILHCLLYSIFPVFYLIVFKIPEDQKKNQKKFLNCAVLSYWVLFITFLLISSIAATHTLPLGTNDILRDLERFLNLDLKILESYPRRESMLETSNASNIVCVESGCSFPDGSFSSQPSVYIIVVALTLAACPTA
jgi:hypothetical protein